MAKLLTVEDNNAPVIDLTLIRKVIAEIGPLKLVTGA
jgi:hypothetical protein